MSNYSLTVLVGDVVPGHAALPGTGRLAFGECAYSGANYSSFWCADLIVAELHEVFRFDEASTCGSARNTTRQNDEE